MVTLVISSPLNLLGGRQAHKQNDGLSRKTDGFGPALGCEQVVVSVPRFIRDANSGPVFVPPKNKKNNRNPRKI